MKPCRGCGAEEPNMPVRGRYAGLCIECRSSEPAGRKTPLAEACAGLLPLARGLEKAARSSRESRARAEVALSEFEQGLQAVKNAAVVLLRDTGAVKDR